MNRTILILVILILWILLGLFLVRKDCCNGAGKATAAAAAPVKIEEPCSNEFSIQDGSSFSVNSENHFQFLRSSENALASRSGLQAAIDQTVNYLTSNNNRKLVVTGLYDQTETYSKVFNNLGEARANSIKRSLMELGVASNQIDIASSAADDACFIRDTLKQGARFTFADMAGANERIDDIRSRLAGKPVTVYFQTDSDNLDLSADQRRDITDLIYYLDNVEDAKVEVSGHTDSSGNRDYNVNLSQERAGIVKDYLMRNGGIGESRMDVAGYGPDRPIATNATEEGKAQNRRVEVTLQ